MPRRPRTDARTTRAPLESPCRLCGSLLGIRRTTGWVCAVCEWSVGTYVDPELPLPRLDVVYYLRLGASVKIGTTFNPRQRFAALPHDEVLAFERGGRELEQQRHLEFAADRLGTSEWFGLTRRLGAHIRRLAAGQDAWHVHARWLSAALSER
jgi:hypothetical protein